MHGVGGEYALDALARAGFADVHVVGEQFAPDPDFPTVAFPNPEEPGATDLLLTWPPTSRPTSRSRWTPTPTAARSACPTPDGWRMLSGDETGWLLGDYMLSQTTRRGEPPWSPAPSCRRACWQAIAARYGARHVETLTGFKWLARADAGVPGSTGVRLRGGDRTLRRPRRGARQGRHQRRGARLRPGGRAARARDDGARRARRPGPPHGVHTTTAVTAARRMTGRRNGDGPVARELPPSSPASP